jgi:hypothetical protein
VKREELSHIVVFFILSVMILAGGFLAVDQIQFDKRIDSERIQAERLAEPEESVLDTLRFLTDPSYEFTESCERGEAKKCTRLSKSIVKVHHRGLDESVRNGDGIKKLPANASINFMLETYSVSRIEDSCSTSYYVTVESFDAFMESAEERKTYTDYSTQLIPDDLMKDLRSGKGIQVVRENCREKQPI